MSSESIKVKDILKNTNCSNVAYASVPVCEVLKIMTDCGDGAVFIVDGDKKIIGIITDGDVRRALNKFTNLTTVSVCNIMSKRPHTVGVDTDLSVALRLMRTHSINVLPVVEKDGAILGSVCFHELVNHFSPERIYVKNICELDGEKVDANVERHAVRYRFAKQFLQRGGVFLDCACGSGYGTEIMSDRASSIIGVDISREAIDCAEIHHKSSNSTFMCDNLENLCFKEESLDAVISFETLEHIPKMVCEAFLRKISVWLKRGGVFIGSSPMLRYKDGNPFITNPYHINEMERDELLKMFRKELSPFVLNFYHQKQDSFLPLDDENTGFCIVVGRKETRHGL